MLCYMHFCFILGIKFLKSAQNFTYDPEGKSLVDLGHGGDLALVLAVVAGGDVLDLEGVPAMPSRYQLVPVLMNEPVQPDKQNVLV